MSDGRIFIFASVTPKAGKEEALEALLRGMTAPSRAEAGCVFYNLDRPTEGDLSFHFFECWRDAAAVDAHREAPHYKDYRARLGDLIAGPIGVRLLQGVDVSA